ncbi:MAG: hypothetical protein Q8R96_13405 [Bacteroidota bacterium]|nr:hypothetical protein [Bacteroidota bacterium]
MSTKLDEIFVSFAEALEDLSKTISNDSSSYKFESSFNNLIRDFGQSVFQSIIGNIPKSKNDRTTILTSMGDVCFPKSHPLATAPGGFKISPYMQEHLCRAGTKLTFEEALCRTFLSSNRIEDVSKGRNYIAHSNYVAHLGNHDHFFDKVLDVLPNKSPLVFICDGAKWIWKWIEEYYPNSTQILDFYHCKEHHYAFAKIYYHKDEHQSRKWVESCIELLMEKKVNELLTKISDLPCGQKLVENEKQKLLTYIRNNEKRINYGLYKERGLLFGSGAIESANRDIIQKRMKLSGQRWTLSGAQQMLNLRVCYKSGVQEKLLELITHSQRAA